MSMSKNVARTIALFGLPISNVTMKEAVASIAKTIDSGHRVQIATANLDFARNARRDSFLHRIICDCAMVLPDGAPMLWAARLFGKPLKQRVTGVDLVPELAKLSAERGYRIFLLGSQEAMAAQATALLEQRYPGTKIVGRYAPPPTALECMDDAEILRRVHAATPDILLVAFGNPKQEIWIHRNRLLLQVPVSIGIGGALEMIAGGVKRAPRWVQRMQMEWAFRMLQEPKRLAPRYAGDLKALLRHLPVELLASWSQPGRPDDNLPKGGVVAEEVEDGLVLRMPEKLTSVQCRRLVHDAHNAAEGGRTLVLDLSQTQRIEADGVGCMLEARRIMLGAGGAFWLSGVSLPVRRVLQSASLLDLLRVAATPAEAIQLAGLNLPEPRERGRVLELKREGEEIPEAVTRRKKRASA